VSSRRRTLPKSALPERVTYFFYGTLMDPAVAARVTASPVIAARLRPAVLEGYRRVRVADQHYPTIFAAPGHRVEGCLFRNASLEVQHRIAWYEDREYQLREVEVIGPAGLKTAAWVFVAGPKMKLTEEEWDFAAWCRQHRRPFLARLDSWLRNYTPSKD
jgi:gamma-glutamylcyclotransferase (GGCT)/AIG2-like uncharacterized protein YtfP